MAMTAGERLEGAADVDPAEEPQVREENLWLSSPFTVDLDQGELIYDRPVDTMLILPYGRERASYVDYLDDYLAALVDVETGEVVGLQIEDFLYRAVKEHPSLIELLDFADRLGMTVDDVRHERQRVLRYWGRFKLRLIRTVERVARRNQPRQQHLMEAVLTKGRLGSALKDALASA